MRVRLLVYLSLVLLLAQVCFAETIRIGVSLPLSGDAAAYGSDFQKIYRFANEKIASNAYELVFEDDQCDPRVAVSVAQRFTAIEKLHYVLGLTCDGVFSSAGPIYNKAGTLVISTAASVVPGENLFHTVPSAHIWPETLLRYITGRHASVAILSEETGFAQEFTAGFNRSAPRFGVRVHSDTFKSSDSDFRSTLLRLKKAKPDAMLLITQTDASLLRLVRQYRELKLDLPIYNVFFASTKTFLDQAGKDAEGITVVDMPKLDEALTPGGKSVYQEFVQAYGPLGSGQAMFASVFEAFRAIHSAIQSQQERGRFLKAAKFQGLCGPWSFDQAGFWTGQELVVKRIHAGAAVRVEKASR